jgi:hypothetical protein
MLNLILWSQFCDGVALVLDIIFHGKLDRERDVYAEHGNEQAMSIMVAVKTESRGLSTQNNNFD